MTSEYTSYCGAKDLMGRECGRAVSGNLVVDGVPMCQRHYKMKTMIRGD